MKEINKAERIALLTEIGNEVLEELLKRHTATGADHKEIVFNQGKLCGLVEEYSEHLEKYRERHIGTDNLVNGDKIAALTGTLIMRHWVFESQTEYVNTPYAEFANETFAVRVAQIFVGHNTFDFAPPDRKQLIHCFAESCNCDQGMLTWTVATMTQFLKWANRKEPAWAD
ncbi:MAG: hypothetical protein HY847_09730 [Betaproteobacteria bacterium]|nr:hypothetical protein [Betaproteobacteria bacterium]